MVHGSLFSGLGGFDLAAEWMGWDNIFHCEINPFCKTILDHYWPNAKSYTDIKQFDGSIFRGHVDILTGGFPCQPYSSAGKRKGTDDARHLWPEMLRVIEEVQPRYIVGENVYGLANWNGGLVFEQVCSDLEGLLYEVWPVMLPAASIGADHQRGRIWFIAYSMRDPWQVPLLPQNNGVATIWQDAAKEWSTYRKLTQLASSSIALFEGWENKPEPHFMDDGFSERLDTNSISEKEWVEQSLHGSGNAIVPQVALQIFKIIQQIEQA